MEGARPPPRRKPRAIVIASAHWETNLPMLTGNAKPETIHDFYNFPEPLYRLRYPAPGAPEIAQHAQALLKAAGFTAGDRRLARPRPRRLVAAALHVSGGRRPGGADLGAAGRSARGTISPSARALRRCAEEGVLIIGSGHMTHNLRDWSRGAGQPQPYAANFQRWVKDKHRGARLRQPGRLPLALAARRARRTRPTSISCRCSSPSAPRRTRRARADLRRHRSRRPGDGRLRLSLTGTSRPSALNRSATAARWARSASMRALRAASRPRSASITSSWLAMPFS